MDRFWQSFRDAIVVWLLLVVCTILVMSCLHSDGVCWKYDGTHHCFKFDQS
jgi:hypothetical protein